MTNRPRARLAYHRTETGNRYRQGVRVFSNGHWAFIPGHMVRHIADQLHDLADRYGARWEQYPVTHTPELPGGPNNTGTPATDNQVTHTA